MTLTAALNLEQYSSAARGAPKCGSYIEITNKFNGLIVVAQIAGVTNYGGYGSLDVSVAVAEALGSIETVAAPVSWKVVKPPRVNKAKAAKAKAAKRSKAIRSCSFSPPSLANSDLVSIPPTEARNGTALAHTPAALGTAPARVRAGALSRPVQPRAQNRLPIVLVKAKDGATAGCPGCTMRFSHLSEGPFQARAELQKDAVVVLGVVGVAVLAFVGFALAVAEPSGQPRRKRATMV